MQYSYKTIFILSIFVILFLSTHTSSQNYSIQFINKGPIYATSSILQDYDSDGDLDIILTRRDATNDKTSPSVEWLENDGSGQFPRKTLFQDLSFPVDLDNGDFNNDGLVDYIVSDRYVSENSGILSLYKKENGGEYTQYIIEDSIRTDQAAAADFDKDGNIDVVAVGFNRPTVSVYWNNADLSFSKEEITDTVIQVELVEANDIDDDNDIDIIYGGGGLGGFKILYNNGNGRFDSSKTLFMTNGQYSNAKRGLTITDLNGDGKKDILAFSGVGFGGMYYLDGASNFSSTIIDIDGIDLGGDIVAADIDNNGLNDIIRQNGGDDYLSILYQETEMNFRVEVLEQNWDSRGPGQMSIGDLDNDGDLDLVFPENGNIDGDISWFENIEGNLYRHYLYHELEAVRIPKITDLDNDGDLDVVVSAGDGGARKMEEEIVWYENRGEINFIEHRIDDDISFPGDLDIGDLDGDGVLDVIATSFIDSSLVWYKKSGSGWLKIVVDENLVQPLGCTVADIDSDDDLDIAICAFGENKIIWYKNNGAGIFSRNLIDGDLLDPQKIKVEDLNNDNENDIIVVSSDTNSTVVLFLNDGNETFSKINLLSDQNAYDVQLEDWDRNGFPDVIVGFDKGTPLGDDKRDIAVLLNDGNANFIDSTLVTLIERTNTLKVIDVDNDNDLDIIFGAGSSGVFPLRLAINENGKIANVKEISEKAVKVFGIDAADISGDGVVDIVASDQRNSTKNLLLMLGDLTTDIQGESDKLVYNNFALNQNYPNPFNPQTTIRFEISEKAKISINIFNVLGENVRSIVKEVKEAGNYEVKWYGKNDKGVLLPSGIYIVQLRSKGIQLSRKMMLLK